MNVFSVAVIERKSGSENEELGAVKLSHRPREGDFIEFEGEKKRVQLVTLRNVENDGADMSVTVS